MSFDERGESGDGGGEGKRKKEELRADELPVKTPRSRGRADGDPIRLG